VDWTYTGCGCAGTYSVTVRDERYRYRKMSYDFLGRLFEARELTASQATYNRAKYSHDERDLLTKIEHYNSDSDNNTKQDRTFNYDGYARLLNQTTPEAGTMSYEY
jgi:YD repeat-containing protein